MELPPNLLHGVEAGNVVLVLGAGASIGATRPDGTGSPAGPELARLLAERFLGGKFADEPLSMVSEFAASEADLRTVQDYIRTIFEPLQPALFHQLLPSFKWAALATTNFDLVVERAYQQCRDRAQDPIPFIKNGDRVEEKLRDPRGLMFLKLHGCITSTADTEVPLILSADQYVTHRKGRDRVFHHLISKAYELPLVFVGHSLRDPDIRQLLLELGSPDQRPLFYAVSPNVSDTERKFWQSKRVDLLDGTFEQFLTSLDEQITSVYRGVVPVPIIEDLPISDRFITRDVQLTASCMAFLNNDVEYVRSGMAVEPVSPLLFYRGSNPRWSAVESSLDVRRDMQDIVHTNAILTDEGDRQCRFYVLKGHAGSGKSVVLQRTAWEAALEFDRLCLYVEPNADLQFEPLHELSRVINERIYLFVDDVGDRVPQVLDLIERCRRRRVPLTVVGAERINEWNMSCTDLEPYLTNEFFVGYLSSGEIDKLLGLLETNKALFRLETMDQEERKNAFTERAGRQLLVALHEATLGKPFEDIIADEYAEIQPELARLMYLGVSFLNQFDVPVRAGIVSRLYNVNFTDFEERFFSPLETVVSARYDWRARDYVYLTRHPHIAELVVERFAAHPRRRLDMTLEMINAMNIDYDADRKAFRHLTRGKVLADQFSDHRMVDTIYSAAFQQAGEDPYLLQQVAIYEMSRRYGDLSKAADHLARARKLAPGNGAFTHSLAELQLRRAESAKSDLQSAAYLKDAETLVRPLAGPKAVSSHGFHTLFKVKLAKLSKVMAGPPELWSDVEFTEVIKEAEQVIQQGLQGFPGDSYLLYAESQLARSLADDARAEAALKNAFARNATNSFIAVRLAKLQVERGGIDDAVATYKESLAAGVTDKQIHFNYAKLLMDSAGGNSDEIEYHLRNGFTEGDSNVEAQFWYARHLYVKGDIAEAQNRFDLLRDLPIDLAGKRNLRGEIAGDAGVTRFSGTIHRLELDFSFITRDGEADRIYLHRAGCERDVWVRLARGSRVWFSIAFNLWGPVAFDVSLE